MSGQSKQCSLYRPRIITLVVLSAVAAVVVVANLSRDQETPLKTPSPGPSYGWPLIWYWGEFKPSAPGHTSVELVRWSASRLAGNLALWFVILAAVGVACQRLARRYGPPPSYCPRFLTLIVLLVTATPVVLANLSRLDSGWWLWPTPRYYGWPLIWYWCEFKRGRPAPNMNLELTGWSGARLACNLVIWFAMLSALGVACQWVARTEAPRRLRVRLLTLVALLVVASSIVFANLKWLLPTPSYGWPMIWRWHNIQLGYGSSMEFDENYSAARLAGNLVIWFLILVAAGASCEWLLRRYRPRLRWSLRTMLAAVGLAAVLCAWYVALRDRANVQDPVITVADDSNGVFEVYLERWGPKWLDLVGADRFGRRVIGANIPHYNDDADEEFLEHLERLLTLRYLNLGLRRPTPGMADTLARMSQLRTLRIDDTGLTLISQECLAAVGKLTALEELHLGGRVERGGLAHLAGLTKLKSLSLQLNPEEESDEEESDETDSDRPARHAGPLLAYLPTLPRLEAVDIRSMWGELVVGDQDLRHLAVHPRLKSLNLSDSAVTVAALAELASLKSLEELAIEDDMATLAGLHSLLALKRLKALHVQRYSAVTDATLAELSNQKSLQDLEIAEDAMMSKAEPQEDVTLEEDEDEQAMSEEGESEKGAMPQQEGISEAGRQLLYAIESLKALRIAQYGSYDESDRLTTLALDRGDAIFTLQSEVDALRGALDALRQAIPGIVIDSDPKWFDRHRGEKHPEAPPLFGP